MKVLKKPDGSMFRLDLKPGQTATLPNGAGTVRFDGFERWNKLQISRRPGTRVALVGCLPRAPSACWVRCSSGPAESGSGPGARMG